MIRSHTKTQPKTHEQQMKYRLTGAAIIVGFAIIIISVLLKEPDIALDTRFANDAGDSKQTFKLEIPLPHSADDSASRTSGYDDDEVKPALLEPETDSAVTEPIPTTTTTADESAEKEESKSIVLTKDKEQDSTVESATSQSKPAKSDSPQPDESSSDIATDGSGWTVRVGTYSKTENVDRVSALLKSHGFDAQYAKVKTALGEATRVWLGPYTKKKTAEKVSTRLKLITGEKGYVTKQS